MAKAIDCFPNDFYPRSPCGERPITRCPSGEAESFLSTLSLRRATCYGLRYSTQSRHFYPRSPCGERLRGQRPNWGECLFLSTLSLRRATLFACPFLGKLLFLSTLSLRRATISIALSTQPIRFLSTLSLRRATFLTAECQLVRLISIHALLAESDGRPMLRRTSTSRFLSTLSLRRATFGLCLKISVGRDFYPRSPCGERPPQGGKQVESAKFLSTLSLRRATQWLYIHRFATGISIHALLAESDWSAVRSRG